MRHLTSRRAILMTAGALPVAALALRAAPAWAADEEQAGAFPQGNLVMGDPDAPVTIVEYASLTCPHCRRFHETAFPDIKRDYIDTGKAKLEFREVYFDRLGLWAGVVARCGGEEKYFGYVDLLLRRQEDWAKADAQEALAELQKIGRLGGQTDEQVLACLQSEEEMASMVENYQTYYKDPALTGTPTVVVEGEKIDPPTAENIAAAIERHAGS